MEIGSLKRWQWIVLSILIGILIGWVRSKLEEEPGIDFSNSLSPKELEVDVVNTYTMAGEKHFFFRGLTVELVADPRDSAEKRSTQVIKDGKFAIVNLPGHSYTNGQKVRVSGSSYKDYTGEFTVQNVTDTSFAIEIGELAPNKPNAELVITAPQRQMYLIKGVKRPSVPNIWIRPEKPVKNFTKEGKIVTLTVPAHGLVEGQRIHLDGSSTKEYTGEFTVSRITADTFRIQVADGAPDKPSGSLKIIIPKVASQPVPYRAFVPFGPYKPVTSPRLTPVAYKPSAMQRFFEKFRIKDPDPPGSILDFLATVQAGTGNSFEYQWWTQPGVRIATWTLGSFIFFGLIFPTLVNIMMFGSIFRPKEEKGASLRNVKTSTGKDTGPKPKVTEKDWDQLKALEAELEAKLAGNTITDKADAPPEEFDTAPLEKVPPKLSDKAAEPVAAVPQSQEHHEYGRRTGDFYPVERPHSPKDKDKDAAEKPDPVDNKAENK